MATPTVSTMPESYTQFGALLRYLRVRARLAQRDLAIAVGYSEAHISRLEQGQRRADADAVQAHFIAALDLTPESPWAQRLIILARSEPYAASPGPPPEEPPAHIGDPLADLLTTKLYRPNARPDSIVRPHLRHQLDQALHVPLTLVAAPAGFGKTTLVADWLASGEQNPQHGERLVGATLPPVAEFRSSWLSLSAGDNDLHLFLRYLIAVLRQFAPGAGASTLAALNARQPAAAPALLVPLLNELAALPHHGLLILDDYHVITAAPIHAALTYLIEQLPPQLHLIIISRDDPPFPLARLRARGRLTELRAAQLRFHVDEAAHFLRETMALSCKDQEVAAIAARTEGWIAGLQLAALALREYSDPAQFVAAFTGSNRYIFDYLAEEVIDRLPNHLRHFLLQTSILDRLSSATCDAVLGIGSTDDDSDSRLLLGELEQRNLFLIPLDSERRWYRYHHLFGEVLRWQLQQGVGRAQIAELHLRAAQWFEANNLPTEAMHHAQAAGDQALCIELIERHADTLLKRGEYGTLRSWLAPLPEAVRRSHPQLALIQAYIHFALHNPEGMQQALNDLEATITAIEDPASRTLLRSKADILGSAVALNRGAYAQAHALSTRALSELPTDELRLRGEALLYLGMASAFLNDTPAAQVAYRQAHRLSLAAGDLYNALFTICTAAGLERIAGRLSAAIELYQHGITLAETHHVEAMPILALLHADYAEVLYERNDLEGAAAQAATAISRATNYAALRYVVLGYCNEARILFARGAVAQADARFLQVAALLAEHPMSAYYRIHYVSSYVPILISSRRTAEAVTLMQQHHLYPTVPLDYEHEPAAIALTRVLLAEGQFDHARSLLSALRQTTTVGARIVHLIPIAILEALLAAQTGAPEAARSALAQALDLGVAEGFMRAFIDEGAPLAALLHDVARHHIHPDYCDRLLAALPPIDKPG